MGGGGYTAEDCSISLYNPLELYKYVITVLMEHVFQY